MMAFMVATIVPNQRAATTVSYGLILLCIVIELFMNSSVFISYLHIKNGPTWLPIFVNILSSYPPFNYTKVNLY